ncbi:MAG: S41 family peptidase [Clostridia bacterium]|nr:S41 family peptidase [Clostridia bacterium]
MEENNNFNNEFNNDFEEKNRIDKTKVMSNAISIAIAIVMSVVVLYALYVVIKPNMTNTITSNVFTQEQIDRLEEAAKIIENDYLYDYDKDKMIDGAIEGMVNSLENVYTYYENEEEYQESLNSGADANYVGIGVHLTFDSETQGIKVLGVMPGSPAEEAGMKSGDIILKVDDMYVNIDTYMDAVDAIKGEKDTTVKLSIYRGEELLEKEIKRTEITENNVSTDIIDDIGYIKVFSFDIGIYDQFRAEYDKLRAQNVKGIVIDLRNNPGGYVYDTLRMLNILLPKAEVLKLVNKAGEEDVFKTDDKEEIDIPLVVLVNQNSASASEIFASAVKDSGKGIVVGTQTFGKGVVQYVRPIKGHGAISIVSAQYFTSSGVVIQDNGIEPNIVVELPEELKNDSYIDRDKDLQLQEALKYIKE